MVSAAMSAIAVVPTAIISRKLVFMPKAATEMTNSHLETSVRTAATGCATRANPFNAASTTNATRKPGSNATFAGAVSLLAMPRAAMSEMIKTTGSSMATRISLTMVAESPESCG